MAPRISITKNRRKLGLTYKAGHKKGDYFGKGYATRLCVDLATASGMDNAARCTAHGRRKSMISSLVNSSVELPMKISCHQMKCSIKQGLQCFEKFEDAEDQLHFPEKYSAVTTYEDHS
jgi:hypothetical protein